MSADDCKKKGQEPARGPATPPEDRAPEATNQVQAKKPEAPPIFKIVRADPKNTLNFEDVADK